MRSTAHLGLAQEAGVGAERVPDLHRVPIARYISGPCCNAEDHVSNSGDPEFLSSILTGLTKLKFLLRKKIASATVLDGIELICGTGCGKEQAEQTLRTGWSDPVRPKQHIYSKMALNLIEKVAAASNTTPARNEREPNLLRMHLPRGEDR